MVINREEGPDLIYMLGLMGKICPVYLCPNINYIFTALKRLITISQWSYSKVWNNDMWLFYNLNIDLALGLG